MSIVTTTQRKRRTIAPKDERMSQLVAAAVQVIAREGLTGTTTAAVTEAAGLSAGIVSLHFGTKENLLVTTLETLAHEHRDRWLAKAGDSSLSPAERLWAIMAAHFDPAICTRTKIAVWFAFFGERRYRDIYRRIVEAYDTERTAAVAECCRLLAADGCDRPVDPTIMARIIENLADGLWLDMLLYPERVTLEHAIEEMRSLLHAHFPVHFPPVKRSAAEDRL